MQQTFDPVKKDLTAHSVLLSQTPKNNYIVCATPQATVLVPHYNKKTSLEKYNSYQQIPKFYEKLSLVTALSEHEFRIKGSRHPNIFSKDHKPILFLFTQKIQITAFISFNPLK